MKETGNPTSRWFAETTSETTQTGTKTPKGDRDGKVEPEESKES